jgi:Protein of unknown function (DUF732).
MRYLIAILLGITLIAPACSSESEQPKADTTSVEQKTQSSDEKTQTPNEAFLAELHREYPDQTEVPDDILIEVAKASCTTLDQGATIEAVFLEIGMAADGPQQTAILSEAASEGIAAYCPEYVPALTKAAERQSR